MDPQPQQQPPVLNPSAPHPQSSSRSLTSVASAIPASSTIQPSVAAGALVRYGPQVMRETQAHAGISREQGKQFTPGFSPAVRFGTQTYGSPQVLQQYQQVSLGFNL